MIYINIYVVKPGDTLYKIGKLYNVDYVKIAYDNEIPIDKTLVVGQTLVILNNNDNQIKKDIVVNGYSFPNINTGILIKALPYMTYICIFSYSINPNGSLNLINDDDIITLAKNYDVVPMMVITNISPEGRFNSDLASEILNNEKVQNNLISNILSIMQSKGYKGIDIDFEYVYPSDKDSYMLFLEKIKNEMKKNDYFVSVAVAPKTSDYQKGLLYEAHDYQKIGEIADHVIIMTYEWGYSRGPARAVAPLNLVEKVINYAVTKIPSNKILMGIPNYGYDWTLPYIEGSVAKSIGNYEAVDIARNNKQSINYDDTQKSPYFNYYDSNLLRHEVWFEDARSIEEKLQLIKKYNLEGASFWTIDRFFPQNYLVLNSLFKIKKL